MYTPTVAELVGDPDAFFAEHFDARPLLRRAALAGDPRELLSIADLDDLLYSEAVRPPYLSLARDGKPVPTESYTGAVDVQDRYVPDAVLPDRVLGHLRAGATVTWNALNHHRPNLRRLTANLAEVFGGRSDVVAFLTPAGRDGYPVHHDPVDVFVVQLEGSKHWRLWPTPADRAERAGPSHPRPEDLGPPCLDVTLSPGDVLYMPYGTPHAASAREQMSLHLSILVQPRRWSEVLTRLVADLLAASPEFADRAPRSGSEGLGKRLAMLADILSTVDGDAMVTPPSLGAGSRHGTPLSQLAAADRVTAGTPVRRAAGARVEVLDEAGDKRRISVNGNIYAMPTAVATALATMPETVPAGRFLGSATPAASVGSVRTLARIGVLEVTSSQGVEAPPQ